MYTWGQIGIGTCLAGPTDLSFIEQDGRTFLAVTNANPYVDFENGSLLLIDWSSVDPTRDRNYMHELRASALMVVDYVGGFGYLPDRRLGILPGRLSPGASGTSANDRTRIIDMSDPDNLSLWAPQPRMTLRDDPQPVVVDSPNGRAYIGNLTDHSVTVLDTTGEILEKVDVAPGPVSTALAFYDADASGSTAEIDTVDLSFPDEAVDDTWTLSWAEGTARIWIPEPTDEGEVGLHRYTDVGLGPVANAMSLKSTPRTSAPSPMPA